MPVNKNSRINGTPGPDRGFVNWVAGTGITFTVSDDSATDTVSVTVDASGAAGPQGPQGVPGNDGAPGVAGADGAPGLQGPPGNDGATGSQGLPGDTGPQGIQGLPGVDGASGAQGPQGIQGIPGTDGAQGAQGIQGVPGNDGAQGPQGIQGLPGNDGAQGVPGNDGAQGIQGIQGPPGPGGSLRVDFAVPVLAALVWTNMPSALSFLLSTATVGKCITKADLTNFTECRLLVNKQGTAGAAASKLILRYWTSFTQTVATFADAGTSEVSVATNVQNTFLATAWVPLAAGAKADVFLAVLGSGGDGTLDPAFGPITAEFR